MPQTRLGVALAAIGVFGTIQLSSTPQRPSTVKALVG